MRLKDNFLAVKFHLRKDYQEYFVKSMLADRFRQLHDSMDWTENDWLLRVDAMKHLAQSLNQKLYYISKNVQEHAKLIKFDKIELDWFRNMEEKHNTYILNQNEFYRFWINPGKSIHISYFKAPEPLRYGFVDGINGNDIPVNEWKVFVIRFDEKSSYIAGVADVPTEVRENFVKLLLFVEMAGVTLKTLKPNERFKIQNLVGGRFDNKVLNETGVNVIYVDTNWNKTLLVHGAFDVEPHFRVQPYGPRANPIYKVIWIEGYSKKGYSKRAGKLRDSEF